MALEESKTDDDTLHEEYGVSLITDDNLTTLLEGSIVDFVESTSGGRFEIRTIDSDNCGGFEIRMGNSDIGGSCSRSC